MKRYRVAAGFLLISLSAIVFAGCRKSDSTATSTADPTSNWFSDDSERFGLDFTHSIGDRNRWDLPQINGSGAAIFDFDGDGRLDLYLLTHGGAASQAKNQLYRNDASGKFINVSAGSGLDIPGDNCGVIVGDVNNDGKPDVLVTQVAGCRLFLNQGGGKFSDITASSGLDNPLWGTSANFFDFDRDGYLDLIIANYLENDPSRTCINPAGKRTYCGPVDFPGTISKLFRNTGAAANGQVRFQDVTIESGLASAKNPGLAVYCADWTGDGWPDILIANDAKPNHLWVNQKNSTFKDEASFRGIAMDGFGRAQAGMGIAVGDVDGNGLMDAYMTHLAIERNTLWLQGPKRGFFADRSAQFALSSTGWRGTGWGAVMRDFDQDGWPDIVVPNGAVSVGTSTPNPALGAHFENYGERNQLFRNTGDGKFNDISEENPVVCGTPNVARGIATGDLDGDGALDFVLTTVENRARIFRNVAGDRGHWMIVRTLDPRLKRDAYGAEVELQCGGRRMIRWINPGDGFQCSSDPRAHFGLGSSTAYERIRVLWPDGLEEHFPGGTADRAIELRRGEGSSVK